MSTSLDRNLQDELQRVSVRYRRVLFWSALAAGWLVLALMGVALLAVARGAGYAVPGLALAAMFVLALVMVLVVRGWLRRVNDPQWLAHRIERLHPDLDSRLLAALEQRPAAGTDELGYLAQSVVDQAVVHARRHEWERIVPRRRLAAARVLSLATMAAFVGVLTLLVMDMRRRPGESGWWHGGVAQESFDIKVEPGDTQIEKGTALLVMAQFGQEKLPAEVDLLYRDADGELRQLRMTRSLDDPLFAGRVAGIRNDLSYAVRYGPEQTRWYSVKVFEYPELRQADARLTFPAYTGETERVIEDTRRITAVEGTRATLTFQLNKPVVEARLVPQAPRAAPARGPGPAMNPAAPSAAPSAPADMTPIELQVDPADPTRYTLSMDLRQSRTFRLQLVDADSRTNRDPSELVFNVTVNRPPELRVQFPARDIDVSALEELTVRAQVWDDFGVRRSGLTYAIAGQEPREVILGENLAARDRRDVSAVIALEELRAQPDQLLSYYLWVEDVGPDGKPRRTLGDMYFAEVRPFEEIFRQGQQLAAGQEEQRRQQREQQQQQQQQQGQQQGQNQRNVENAEDLAEMQKQIIAATWQVIRRETSETPTPQLAPDAQVIQEEQAQARAAAESLGEGLSDERSQGFLQSVLRYMDEAIERLQAAQAGPTSTPLAGALSSEQAAYQDILKLRAREFEVTRGQRQQGRQAASQQRRQRQLSQMDMNNEENRYETQRSAQNPRQQQQAQAQEQRETRQALSRLRELSQRQQDLNRQMRENQAALAQARTPQQQEEIQRQLQRLRDQQQQQLRDADELAERMDQPQNQQQMADARRQLDQTRDNLQRASEALQQGQTQQAAAAGQRAAEQLSNLEEQFRRQAAGQFGQAMQDMRAEARELESNEEALSQRMVQLDEAADRPAQRPAGLRDAAGQQTAEQRLQVAQDLARQREDLQSLLDNMRQTVEEAETSEPLLSRQLYDTLRQTQQSQPQRALDSSRQLVQQGFLPEARQVEREAGQSIARLREGVEQAATSVLGDETAALRRARDELDALAQQLDREIGQNQARADRGNQPGEQNSERQLARGSRQGTSDQPGTQGQQDRQGQAGQGQDGQPPERQLASSQGRGQPQGRGQEQNPQGPAGRQGQPGQQEPQGQQGQQAQQGQSGQPGQQAQARGAGGRGQPQDQQPGEGRQDQQGQPLARGGQGRGELQQDQQGRGGAGLRGDPQRQGQMGQARGDQRGGQQGDRQSGDDPQGQVPQGQLAAGQQGQEPQADQQGQQGRGARGGDPQQADARGERGQLPQGDQPRGGFADGLGSTGWTGPITGDGFREFSDRLRDVEEMVGDPALRAQAARIRERAAAARAEFRRHTEQPNWDMVNQTIGRPLYELRDAVAQELLRRQSGTALVPIDREPVPPEFSEQVRRYYERLGSGR